MQNVSTSFVRATVQSLIIFSSFEGLGLTFTLCKADSGALAWEKIQNTFASRLLHFFWQSLTKKMLKFDMARQTPQPFFFLFFLFLFLGVFFSFFARYFFLFHRVRYLTFFYAVNCAVNTSFKAHFLAYLLLCNNN